MPLPVHKACIMGNKSVLKKIIRSESFSTLESKDEFGITPLIYCVINNRMELASLLLKAGVHVDNSDASGQTALHIAANQGNHRFVKLLLSYNASCRQKDLFGASALHLAAINNNSKVLSAILKVIKPGEIDIQDSSKKTALHWCSAYSNVENTKLLLMKGANICIPDEDGKTPLHWAVMNANNPQALKCVKVLLEKAFYPLRNWQDYEGRSALHLAVATGSTEVVRFLACSDDCNIDILDNTFCTPLHWAAKKGLLDKADILLNRRATHTSADDNGATPLHYAAYYNRVKMVSLFLSRNYIHDVGDSDERNSFMWAAARNSTDILRVMAENGANLNYTNRDGMSALHAAACQGHISAIEILLDLKISTEVKDKYCMTPLLRACEMGRTSAARVLINHGANVNATDINKCSAIHWCAIGGHAYLCQVLLQNGAQCNAQDDFGMTALHYSCMNNGSLNCVSVLLEAGANPNILDIEGKNPLHWAVFSNNQSIVRLLCEYEANLNALVHQKEWVSPLDMAVLNGSNIEIVQILETYGALRIQEIKEIAASRIQSWFREKCIKNQRCPRLAVENEESNDSAMGTNVAFLKQCQNVIDEYGMMVLPDEGEIPEGSPDYIFSTSNFCKNCRNISFIRSIHHKNSDFKTFIGTYELTKNISPIQSIHHKNTDYKTANGTYKRTICNYGFTPPVASLVEIKAATIIQQFWRKHAMKKKFQKIHENIKNAFKTADKRISAEKSWNQKLYLFYNKW